MIRLGLLITLILALPLVFQIQPLEVLKLKTFDAFVAKQQPSGYFVTLNITDEDVRSEGGWPFPRVRVGEIHQQLIDEGALGVGWVISFIDKDRFGGDFYLNRSFDIRDLPTVVAAFDANNGIYPEPVGTVILGESAPGISIGGYMPNIKEVAEVADQGIVSAPVDVDNLVRRIPLLFSIPDGWVPSFGTQVLKSLVGADTYIIKTNEYGLEEIRVRGLPPVKVDGLGRKWISWVDTPSTTLAEMNVKDKFVFVGVTAKGVFPQIAVPTGLAYPHQVQTALAESILIQNSPYIPDWHLPVEILIFGIFVFTIWLLTSFLGVTQGLASATGLFISTGAVGYHLIKKGILLDFTWTLVGGFVSGAIAFYLNFRKQYKLRLQIKKQFEHYLDPRQVKKLQDNPGSLVLGGERRNATFLFTDVRGFTALSEKLEPEEVTKIMNRVLTIQADTVKQYDGMVDKYIGDAMMAIFNAPLDMDNHEIAAVLCAKEIQEKVKLANLGVEIGVGINSGPAVIGNMGSETRFDYTAIGDAVNQAARYESATKEVGVDILIGHTTAHKAPNECTYVKDIKVKGKTKPLQVYTISD